MKNVFLIINYNDSKTTIELLENIKNYKTLDKIIVVDNNSSDNSFDTLKRYSNKIDKIEIIKSKENKGYGAGINKGAKYIKKIIGDAYIIISNSDIIIKSNNDIEKLISNFNNDIALIAPIIKENENLNRGWKIPTPIQDSILNIVFIHKYLRPKMLYYIDEYYERELVEVEAVSGCFFIINSKYLEEINYFDENLFLYYEENTLSKKLKKINKKIIIDTSVEVIHNHSVTIDKSINRINKYKILKSSQMYFQKNYNNANKIEEFFLNLTSKLTLLILRIYMLNKK